MKAILEFCLPEEEPEFAACTYAGKWHSALCSIEREIDLLLNGERTEAEAKMLENLRNLIPFEIHDIG
ncbi:MAG: hypothetical protein E6Q35_02310 [Chryseobacterium cucumeris]|nr:MAG: hypothetical protein E6Q35_02310 [Chryseobacterium cucumeris]